MTWYLSLITRGFPDPKTAYLLPRCVASDIPGGRPKHMKHKRTPQGTDKCCKVTNAERKWYPEMTNAMRHNMQKGWKKETSILKGIFLPFRGCKERHQRPRNQMTKPNRTDTRCHAKYEAMYSSKRQRKRNVSHHEWLWPYSSSSPGSRISWPEPSYTKMAATQPKIDTKATIHQANPTIPTSRP